MKKFWKKTEGFTLVELVVVIAVLGILAGVGTVGYSGYVKKANIAADQQLVSQVKNALEIAKYTQSGLPKTGYVMLSKNRDTDYDSDAKIQEALVNAFGSVDAVNALRIKGTWGNSATTAEALMTALNDPKYAAALTAICDPNGDGLSYTDYMPELMSEMRYLAEDLQAGDSQVTDSVALFDGVADLMTGYSVDDVKYAWRNTMVMTYNGAQYDNSPFYNEVNSMNPETDPNYGTKRLEAKGATAGLIRAQNTCFALYVKNLEGTDPQYENWSLYYDAMSTFSVGNSPIALAAATNAQREELFDKMAQALVEKGGMAPSDARTKAENDFNNMSANHYQRYIFGDQANNDAAAFAVMMGIVDNMEIDPENHPSVEEYFNSATGAVEMFQGLVRGTITKEDLENAVPSGDDLDNYKDVVILSIMGDQVLVSPANLLK